MGRGKVKHGVHKLSTNGEDRGGTESDCVRLVTSSALLPGQLKVYSAGGREKKKKKKKSNLYFLTKHPGP